MFRLYPIENLYSKRYLCSFIDSHHELSPSGILPNQHPHANLCITITKNCQSQFLVAALYCIFPHSNTQTQHKKLLRSHLYSIGRKSELWLAVVHSVWQTQQHFAFDSTTKFHYLPPGCPPKHKKYGKGRSHTYPTLCHFCLANTSSLY